tara:strand:- start:738 stop:1379 length:642 start_codon:yes stop_codon:yes gene_type:complete
MHDWLPGYWDSMADRLTKKTLFLQKDPIIQEGRQQIAIGLQNGWVAKVRAFSYEGVYTVNTGPTYSGHPLETMDLVEKFLGHNIPRQLLAVVRDDSGIRLEEASKYGQFMLVPDVSEGGRYIVRDIEPDEDFSQFRNGAEVMRVLDSNLAVMMDLYEHADEFGLETEFDGHVEQGPLGAIKRMFNLVIDPESGDAFVYPVDFDHLVIHKKETD